MPETVAAAIDLDLISFFKAIPDTRMRRGRQDSYPAPAGGGCHRVGIFNKFDNLRDLERFDPAPPRRTHCWHWIRDTQLHEGKHRYKGSGAGVVVTFRTASLNLLRLAAFDSIREGLHAVMHDIRALLRWRCGSRKRSRADTLNQALSTPDAAVGLAGRTVERLNILKSSRLLLDFEEQENAARS